ncbi:probable glutathione peroxidase 8 isoform X2 [Callorhinchus milii]|uniref:probable glutathione peroxidase 8 isoform X2 n=1 Tax=Callorhinchus milii TaxID=7868 RepID=UPI001C3FB189|nr:probable glutathione peroxidase 8 isoform X2 [Callorhinchus milii]
MESVSAVLLKCSAPKARIFVVFTCMLVCTSLLCLLQLKLFSHRKQSFYSFEVQNSKGKTVSLEKYRGKFGDSEPGSNYDIESFAKANYGVTFPIFSKIKVLGSEAHPAFRFLVDSTNKEPRWNFWKYLVNPEGQVIKVWKTEEPLAAIKQEVSALVAKIILKKREEL